VDLELALDLSRQKKYELTVLSNPSLSCFQCEVNWPLVLEPDGSAVNSVGSYHVDGCSSVSSDYHETTLTQIVKSSCMPRPDPWCYPPDGVRQCWQARRCYLVFYPCCHAGSRSVKYSRQPSSDGPVEFTVFRLADAWYSDPRPFVVGRFHPLLAHTATTFSVWLKYWSPESMSLPVVILS